MVYGTPPTQRATRGRYDWEAIAEDLRAHPHEWARIFENDLTSLATAIRINGIKVLRSDRGFRVRTSNNKRGLPGQDPPQPRTCDLWLRYEPELDTERKAK